MITQPKVARAMATMTTLGVCIFLYTPIIMLLIISCNGSALAQEWGGFSLVWYREVLSSPTIWQAIQNSLLVACGAVCLSLTLGCTLVIYGTKTIFRRLFILFYGGIAVPEIIIASGLLMTLALFAIPASLITLTVAHTLLGLGYVVPMLYDRLMSLDHRLMEASMDLGASPAQTVYKITLPLMAPAIATAALLVFIISLDDFVISFFCSGAATQTLPMLIFSMIRSGQYASVNALSAILLIITTSVILLLYVSYAKKVKTTL